MNNTSTDTTIKNTCESRVKTLGEYTTSKEVVLVNGETLSASALIATYQASLDARDALKTQRTAVSAALHTRDVADAASIALEAGVRSWVIGKFGATSEAAIAFGYAPKPKAVVTVVAKAAALTQRTATRKARGIIGKNQRKAIKAPAETTDDTEAATQSTASAAAVNGATTTVNPGTTGNGASH